VVGTASIWMWLRQLHWGASYIGPPCNVIGYITGNYTVIRVISRGELDIMRNVGSPRAADGILQPVISCLIPNKNSPQFWAL
jgi:hypothetical protein